MKKPDLTGITAEQLAYINYMEGCLEGTPNLITSLNHLNNVLADDIRKIADGNDFEVYYVSDEDGNPERKERTTLTLLCPDKDDKTFDKVMKIISSQDHFKKLAIVKTVTEDEVKTSTKLTIPVGGNAFEHIIREVKKNGGSKS